MGSCNGNDEVRIGYAVGGGVEYAFTPNVSAKLEGLYVDLEESRRATSLGPAGTPALQTSGKGDNGFGVVRAGLKYRF